MMVMMVMMMIGPVMSWFPTAKVQELEDILCWVSTFFYNAVHRIPVTVCEGPNLRPVGCLIGKNAVVALSI
jgi:hypothetical protein